MNEQHKDTGQTEREPPTFSADMGSNTEYDTADNSDVESKPILSIQQGYGASESSGEEKDSEDSLTELNEVAYLHHRPGGTSNFDTITHIIKGNIGTGILAMPSAFSNAGILVGTIGLCFLGMICIHCMHLLVNCSHYLCSKVKKPFLSYSGVAEESFKLHSPALRRHSNLAKQVVNVFLMITQLGFCCVYVLFMAQNIQFIVLKITHNTGPKCDLNKPVPLIVYELCTLAIFIPFTFIKNIKALAPFSMMANVASAVGLGIVLYDILIAEGLNSVTRLPLFKGWSTLPVYFGSAIYAFEGIGVVLPLENKMREPKAFPATCGVLNLGMVIVCTLYITIGFYGYIEYGENAAGSITLNLSNWYGIVVQALFTFCIFVSYGLMFYVPMEIIGDSLEKTRLAQFVGPKIFDYILRTSFVIGTFAVAAAVGRYLDLLISLIGSVASSGLAIIFPPLLDIITFWPHRHEERFYWLKFIKNIFIISFGVLGFVSGTAVTIQKLIVNLASHENSNSCPPAS